MKSTNYYNTFIEVSDDCPVHNAEMPGWFRGNKTVALMQFEMIATHPYRYTSDEVLFAIYAHKHDFSQNNEAGKEAFFSKGQACFRASPLGKHYGWGVHYDTEGRMALYGMETSAYQNYKNDPALEHTKAVRNKRVK